MRPTNRRRDRQELRRSLLPVAALPPVPGQRDCAHGCDGECELYPGPSECGMTCHPGELAMPAITSTTKE